MRARLVNVLVVVAFVAIGATPGIIGAQIDPGPSGPVDYGPTITTNIEKLYAVYALIRQTVDEYNRQSAIASGNVSKYVDKFRTYSENEFKETMNALMDERNRLKLAIRRGVYSDAEWAKLEFADPEVLATVIDDLWGNKTAEEVKPTLAGASVLDDLKAVDLGQLEPTPGNDPLEDYTTYTERDEGDDLSISANLIDANSALPRYDYFWLQYDKGTDHFDGDFTHSYMWITTSLTTYTLPTLWALVNDSMGTSYDMRSLVIDGYEYTRNYLYSNPTRNLYLDQKEDQGGSDVDYGTWSLSTQYYVTVDRDDDYGTYGRTHCYLCTGNYYGESGSSLVHDLVIDLVSQDDYRYMVATSSYNANDAPGNIWTADIEDLDLHEGAGPTAVPFSFGYILGG